MIANQETLIRNLINGGYLKTPTIIEAFKKVDRKDFVASGYEDLAYFDKALPIGYGQTISQPLTVAFMMELLQPKPGEKILDVGSGSGWTTTLLAYLVSRKGISKSESLNSKQIQNPKSEIHNGLVIGVEKIPELVEFGKKNLAKYKFKNAVIMPAGGELGLPGEAPFDRILVSAAASELPMELVNQLKIGGRMVIPIRNSIWRIDEVSVKEVKKEEYFGFSFVPLISKDVGRP